ncbi:hypothetical protein ACFX1S_035462 [Malus domestica]
MDALFDSINVRELLSAQDLSDPTTPLSAPDLRLLIQRLDSHSLQIKSKIQSYLLSHHQDFANLFSVCNDAVSRSNQISDDVVQLLSSNSNRPIEAEIGQIMKQMSATNKRRKRRNNAVLFLYWTLHSKTTTRDVTVTVRMMTTKTVVIWSAAMPMYREQSITFCRSFVDLSNWRG